MDQREGGWERLLQDEKKGTAIIKNGNAIGLISSTISGSSRCVNNRHLHGDDPGCQDGREAVPQSRELFL